jgi:pyruvate-formate lyase-activating enzyme
MTIRTAVARVALESVKTACLSHGVRPTPAALRHLRADGTTLTIHEYPTTGGLTLVLEEDVYVNVPFDEWFCVDSGVTLDYADDGLAMHHAGERFEVLRVLPLPGYLERRDDRGRRVADVVMSHTDRIRLSPFVGCAHDCAFCDLPAETYRARDAEQLMAALHVAVADEALPARHVLISGGSPRRAHYETFISTCEEVIRRSAFPVDVMFSPMIDEVSVVDRLVSAGVHGLSINLELYSTEAADRVLKTKSRSTREYFEPTMRRAVELLGSGGRVRSLLIPGLEAPESTIAGVEYLASLGCDPVLSPFRPARDIALCDTPPPSVADLALVLAESRAIVRRYGVALGPDCVPCQHNTLTFPWDRRTGSS